MKNKNKNNNWREVRHLNVLLVDYYLLENVESKYYKLVNENDNIIYFPNDTDILFSLFRKNIISVIDYNKLKAIQNKCSNDEEFNKESIKYTKVKCNEYESELQRLKNEVLYYQGLAENLNLHIKEIQKLFEKNGGGR